MAHPCKTKRASVGRHEERTEVDIRGGRNVLRPHKAGRRGGRGQNPPGAEAAPGPPSLGDPTRSFCGKISLALTLAQTRVSVPPRRKLSRRGEVAEQRTAAQRKAAPSEAEGAAVGRNQQPGSTLDSEPYFPFSMYSLRCFAHASARDCWPRVAWVPSSRPPWLLLCTS